MRYFIETYGCQMNVADSELIATLLEKEGYRRAKEVTEAQVILLNTCAIREKAEETVHNRLDNLRALKRANPDVLMGVVGCMAQNLRDSLLESKPFVDLILGPDNYRNLPEILQQRMTKLDHVVDTRLSRFEIYDELFPTRTEGVNAWVSIMRGCDKFCTFCIVPFTRGRERSRSLEMIVNEVTDAVQAGYPEITLLGQNVNSYHHLGQRFPELLGEVAKVSGLRRIRFTSPHPQDVDDHLLEVMSAHKNICKSIHLPLQAGSDKILRRMNRNYSRTEFLELVDKIRTRLPEVCLTTDIIVGFPGESKAEFEVTLEVMRQVQFDSAFTFKYSSRPGTKAEQFSDHVAEEEKQRRLQELILLQKQITLRRNQLYVGRIEEVLVEKTSKKSTQQWAGRTDGNKWVVFDKEDTRIGDFVIVQIDAAHGVALQGHLVKKGADYHAVA